MKKFPQNNQILPSKLKFPLFGFLLLLFFTFYSITNAQSKSFVWDQYDVVITLLPNGDLLVEETQTLNFEGEPFTFGFATIPISSAGNNDGIRDLTVREGDFLYTEDHSNAPGTYSVSTGNDEVRIDWYFEPALGKRTYTFSYVVDGGVIVGTAEQGDGDQIFWKAIPADHPAYVLGSTVTIILPEGVAPQQYTGTTDYLVAGYVDGDDSTVATQVSENGRIITYQLTRPLPTDVPFEVRVQFPNGLLDIPIPEWQSNLQIQDTLSLAGYAVSLLCLIFGPLLVLLIWFSFGRDPQLGIVVPEYITQPPSNLRPAVVGTLTDERADMRDIVSIIVDLAQRGYLTITEASKKDHTFHLTDKDQSDLRPYESQLIRALFGSEKSKKLKDLTYVFRRNLPKLRTLLYRELVQEKLVHGSPDGVRGSYKAVSISLFIVAGMGIVFGGMILDDAIYGPLAFFPSLAIGVTSVAFYISSRHMPRKTDKGTEATMKWLAFKTYLQNIDQYQDLSQASDIFEKYLPYATAFGLDRSWIYKFAQQPNTSIPPWYIPRPPRTRRKRGGVTQVAPTGGSRGNAPSLDTLSDSMTGSLESMSANLTRMLNSTASTLSSAPPSSSSSSGSSGGFSSGFSGGSSFSSSGGGSRGFG